MGLIVSEVYDALIEAGTSPEKATAAAAAVPLAENVATRDDIAGIRANMATQDDVVRIDANVARIDANIAEIRATMVTQDDLMGIRAEIAKIGTDIAVLKFAVFGGGSVMLGAIGTLLKLALFP